MKTPQVWNYKGFVIFPANRNSSGIRWTVRSIHGYFLRSDTKAGMRQLITNAKGGAQ